MEYVPRQENFSSCLIASAMRQCHGLVPMRGSGQDVRMGTVAENGNGCGNGCRKNFMKNT